MAQQYYKSELATGRIVPDVLPADPGGCDVAPLRVSFGGTFKGAVLNGKRLKRAACEQRPLVTVGRPRGAAEGGGVHGGQEGQEAVAGTARLPERGVHAPLARAPGRRSRASARRALWRHTPRWARHTHSG